jgi:hypothetical protein
MGLCQDCLREVHAVWSDERGDWNPCPSCGGDVCACHSCKDWLKEVRAWDFSRGPFSVGLQAPIVAWSPGEGGKLADAG